MKLEIFFLYKSKQWLQNRKLEKKVIQQTHTEIEQNTENVTKANNMYFFNIK